MAEAKVFVVVEVDRDWMGVRSADWGRSPSCVVSIARLPSMSPLLHCQSSSYCWTYLLLLRAGVPMPGQISGPPGLTPPFAGPGIG